MMHAANRNCVLQDEGMLWSDHFVTSASRDLTLTQIVFRVSVPAFCLL